MKKIILLILFLFTFIVIHPIIGLAVENKPKITTPQLTEEQRKILHEKKQELREKYFTKWKEKSREEKQQAIDGYKKELEDFCIKEFGIPFDQLRKRFHRFDVYFR